MGKDTILLERVILNPIMTMSLSLERWSKTRIIVPVDVEISLSVNRLYGDLTFLHQPKRALRNEITIIRKTRDYLKSNKSVKIFLTTMVEMWRLLEMKKQSYLLIGWLSFLFILFDQ